MRLATISDELDERLEPALDGCVELGLRHVELRVVDGRNVVELDDAALDRAAAALAERGLACPVIDSPFLKTRLPEIRWDHLDRALVAARRLGARWVRVFAGLRTARPEEALEPVCEALAEALRRAETAGVELVLEVEHTCNVGTAAEAARLLDRLADARLRLVLDPGNEAMLRREPLGAEAYEPVRGRVAHVHVKDADAPGRWVRVGTGLAGWDGLLTRLAADGYDGLLSIETHYDLEPGGRPAATAESVEALRAALARVPASHA